MQLFGSFYCARAAARAFIKQDVKGSIVFTASMASYRPNSESFAILSPGTRLTPCRASSISALRGFESRRSKHDAHFGEFVITSMCKTVWLILPEHGVGPVWHPSEQCQSRFGQDGNDLLG